MEGPVWSDEGNFLLWSDVKWVDENGVTCGMIWKWDETTQSLSKFVPCSGLIGPGEVPDNIDDFVEGGSNGLYWGWEGTKDLLICQHGKSRIVRINIDDVDENGEIDPSLVTVLVDSYNGTALNSPNDMYMYNGALYFTDPPFGKQLFSSEDPIASAFEDLSQDIGVYVIQGDPGTNTPTEPESIINFGDPGADEWEAPNGVAINNKGDMFLAVTDFDYPRFHVHAYDAEVGEWDLDPLPLENENDYSINNNTQGYPDLNDGVTYSPALDVFFAAGPAGVHIFNGSTFELLGFLRVDDLSANNVLGGGYLWLMANTRIMRIPLSESAAALAAGEEQGGPNFAPSPSPEGPTSTPPAPSGPNPQFPTDDSSVTESPSATPSLAHRLSSNKVLLMVGFTLGTWFLFMVW